MPLQVKIEEGRRSSPDRVSGLRYCQYSQEKISLISLLADLVQIIVLYGLKTSNARGMDHSMVKYSCPGPADI